MRSSTFAIAILASLGLVTAHPHKIALSQGSGSEYAAPSTAVGLEKMPTSPPLPTATLVASLTRVPAEPVDIPARASHFQASGSEYAASSSVVGLEKTPSLLALAPATSLAGRDPVPAEAVRISEAAVLSHYNGSEYATSTPAIDPRDNQCTIANFNRLVFQTDMSTFQTLRNIQHPSCWDWTSNGCSHSPDHPLTFNYLPSCQRHDFGYQNAKLLGIETCDERELITRNFKRDLMEECAGKSWFKRKWCDGTARSYVFFVRQWSKGKGC